MKTKYLVTLSRQTGVLLFLFVMLQCPFAIGQQLPLPGDGNNNLQPNNSLLQSPFSVFLRGGLYKQAPYKDNKGYGTGTVFHAGCLYRFNKVSLGASYGYSRVSEEKNMYFVDSKTTLTNQPLQLLGLYHFNTLKTWLNPFAGIGTGLNFGTLKVESEFTDPHTQMHVKTIEKNKDKTFNFMGIAGFEFNLTHNAGVTIDASYTHAPSKDLYNSLGGWCFEAGLTYHLGQLGVTQTPSDQQYITTAPTIFCHVDKLEVTDGKTVITGHMNDSKGTNVGIKIGGKLKDDIKECQWVEFTDNGERTEDGLIIVNDPTTIKKKAAPPCKCEKINITEVKPTVYVHKNTTWSIVTTEEIIKVKRPSGLKDKKIIRIKWEAGEMYQMDVILKLPMTIFCTQTYSQLICKGFVTVSYTPFSDKSSLVDEIILSGQSSKLVADCGSERTYPEIEIVYSALFKGNNISGTVILTFNIDCEGFTSKSVDVTIQDGNYVKHAWK